MPSGAQVYPKMPNGERECNRWKIHYNRAEKIGDGTARRGGAEVEDMFPASRKGSLDAEVLKRCGLSTTRMVNEDALFWFQMLLHIGDPTKSGSPVVTQDLRSTLTLFVTEPSTKRQPVLEEHMEIRCAPLNCQSLFASMEL